jgi:hypothetical protein
MKSNLTKLQVSRILKIELEKSFLGLQILAFLCLIQLISFTIFFNPLGLGLSLVFGLSLFYEYKRIINKLNELKEKYESVN